MEREKQKVELNKALEAAMLAEEIALQNRAAINALRKAIAYLLAAGQDVHQKVMLVGTLKQQQPDLEKEAVECGQRFDQLSKEFNSPTQPKMPE